MNACQPALPFRRLSPSEALQWMRTDPDLRIFDVRSPVRYAEGHIAGASHLSPDRLGAALATPANGRSVLIYCNHGVSSQEYARTFTEFGFESVADLIGGYRNWQLHHKAKACAKGAGLPSNLRLWLGEQGLRSDAINAPGENGQTPLMFAARRGEALMVDLLIKAGAEIDACNSDGNQALWSACLADSLASIEILIGMGAQVDHQNDNGTTCLMYAASAGKEEVVSLLLDSGADSLLANHDDFTALDVAASIGVLKLLRSASRQEQRGRSTRR